MSIRISEREQLLEDLSDQEKHERFLRTREVALLFQVSERAVTDWATKGRLPSIRTPGGHRRYPAPAVAGLLRQQCILP